MPEFDAVLLIAFGGPEQPEDIRPFLENVVRGRSVPPERLEEVAHHYEAIGGRSPLNELTYRQLRALVAALHAAGTPLPAYLGMRNWHPLLADTIRQMQADGLHRVVGLIMAPHQSDASWERYQRNVADAMAEAEAKLEIVYAEPFFDHPMFIEANADRVAECLQRLEPSETTLVFTAHSVPLSDPHHQRYAEQVMASARAVAQRLNHAHWQVAYQSRSGRPQDPWLEPDLNETLRALHQRSVRNVVVQPIGFVCDHVEVLYDLDHEAAATAQELGLKLLRARTVHDDPKFICALVDRVRSVTQLQNG